MTKSETRTEVVIKSLRKLAYDISKQDVAAVMRTDPPTEAMHKEAKATADAFETVLQELAETLNTAEEAFALNDKLSDILTRTVNVLRGEPPPLTLWSWHDLPELAAAAKQDLSQVPFAIIFDDYDRRHEIVIGESVAWARFHRISDLWNAHLFVKLASNSRDEKYPNAVLSHKVPEGCTPADAKMLRAANHALADESHELQQELGDLLRQINEFTATEGKADFETGRAKALLDRLTPAMHRHRPEDPESFTPANLDRLLSKGKLHE